MLLEERHYPRNYDLFSHFSQNLPGDLEVSLDYPPFDYLYLKLESLYFNWKKRNQPIPKISVWNFLRRTASQSSRGRSFLIFLNELITPESEAILTLEVKDGPPITLNLNEREKWLIKVFLKLHVESTFIISI